MKRNVIIALVASAGFIGTAVPAQAACRTVGCLSRQLGSVTRELHRAEQTISSNASVYNRFSSCLGETPVNNYGDLSGGTYGYVYDAGSGTTQNTTGLDITNPGDTIGSWMLTNTCNSVTTAFTTARSHVERRSVPIISVDAPFGHFAR